MKRKMILQIFVITVFIIIVTNATALPTTQKNITNNNLFNNFNRDNIKINNLGKIFEKIYELFGKILYVILVIIMEISARIYNLIIFVTLYIPGKTLLGIWDLFDSLDFNFCPIILLIFMISICLGVGQSFVDIANSLFVPIE